MGLKRVCDICGNPAPVGYQYDDISVCQKCKGGSKMTEQLGYEWLGPVSTGTMRNSDLLEKFHEFAETIMGELGGPDDLGEAEAKARHLLAKNSDFDLNHGKRLVEAQRAIRELRELFNEYAPEDVHFGTAPGDGAAYGYFINEDVGEERAEYILEKAETSERKEG